MAWQRCMSSAQQAEGRWKSPVEQRIDLELCTGTDRAVLQEELVRCELCTPMCTVRGGGAVHMHRVCEGF
jgi:hypothetical protein